MARSQGKRIGRVAFEDVDLALLSLLHHLNCRFPVLPFSRFVMQFLVISLRTYISRIFVGSAAG